MRPLETFTHTCTCMCMYTLQQTRSYMCNYYYFLYRSITWVYASLGFCRGQNAGFWAHVFQCAQYPNAHARDHHRRGYKHSTLHTQIWSANTENIIIPSVESSPPNSIGMRPHVNTDTILCPHTDSRLSCLYVCGYEYTLELYMHAATVPPVWRVCGSGKCTHTQMYKYYRWLPTTWSQLANLG